MVLLGAQMAGVVWLCAGKKLDSPVGVRRTITSPVKEAEE